MSNKKSAVKGSNYCLCGSVRFSLDLEKLLNQETHQDTLLEMSEIIDQMLHDYQRHKKKHEPHLKIV